MPRLDMSRPAMETGLPSISSKCALISALLVVWTNFVISNGFRPSACKLASFSRRTLIWSPTEGSCAAGWFWFFFSCSIVFPQFYRKFWFFSYRSTLKIL